MHKLTISRNVALYELGARVKTAGMNVHFTWTNNLPKDPTALVYDDFKPSQDNLKTQQRLIISTNLREGLGVELRSVRMPDRAKRGKYVRSFTTTHRPKFGRKYVIMEGK